MNHFPRSLVLLAALVAAGGLAEAKPSYKKDLGVANCNVCHVSDKKAANDSNPLWKKAKEHSAKLAEGKGDFAGKKSCNDCHKGKQKPPARSPAPTTPPKKGKGTKAKAAKPA